eukprot:748383-Hanusia_phi.AAC.2
MRVELHGIGMLQFTTTTAHVNKFTLECCEERKGGDGGRGEGKQGREERAAKQEAVSSEQAIASLPLDY